MSIKPETVKPLRAPEIAMRAAELVGGDRDRQHGQKEDNFKRIAKLWQAYLEIRRDPRAPLEAVDVGHMMVLMKTARTQSGDVNPDDYVDAAGYAACAGEIATHNAAPTEAQAKVADPFREAEEERLMRKEALRRAAGYTINVPRNPNSDM